jgi:type IV secretion system protein VirD4
MSHSPSLPFPAWPRSRQIAAVAATLGGVAALAAAAVYLSGALFLVLNKADPRQAHWASIVDYWGFYATDALLRKKLLTAIAVAGFGTLVVLPGALVAAARPQRALHGDARFANTSEVASAGLLGDRGHQGQRGGGAHQPAILIGRYRGRFLSLPGQLSVMLSAPTRSGKGVGVVIPNLLNWPDSVVVLDIKGENYDITAGFRAAHGQAVYAFSPFDERARSHRWNPLSAIRTSPLHRVGDLLAIGQVFFPNDVTGTSSEAFFNDQARNLFLGLGLVLLETPSLPRTIGELLRQSSGKGKTLKDHLTGLIAERNGTADTPPPGPDSHQAPPSPLSDECVDALQRLLSNSDNTLSSVVATFNAPLTIFADAIVDAATSADDFSLDDVRRRPMSIYVRIPPNRLASARPLLNLFFSQLVNLNTRELPEQDVGLTRQCLLVNDEFTAMGRVSVISSAAAFLAGYNLRLLTVVQAMSQLDAVYGDKDARTFATNHGLQILFAPREQRDADEYSAMLGQFTERATSHGRSRSFSQHGHSSVSTNESQQRRALLLPQEFKELGSERLVVIVENCKPILAEKIRYHRDKVFRDRLRRPPTVPRMGVELHLARVQLRWRYADDELDSVDPLRIEMLAHDFSHLPDLIHATPGDAADALLDRLTPQAGTLTTSASPGTVSSSRFAGGWVEPAADDDGVLIEPQDIDEPSPQ